MALSFSISRPAPKSWRKFENAYIIAVAPALTAAVQGWGMTDKTANHVLIVIGLFGAFIKGIGFIIADGEDYTTQVQPSAPKDQEITKP